MRFGFVTIPVQDMETSIGFYSGLLGLQVLRRQAIHGGELAFLGEESSAQLELISGGEGKPSGFSIGIEVPSLDQAAAMLAEHGYPVIRGPFSPAPGTRFSFVRDPDGVEVELIEQQP